MTEKTTYTVANSGRNGSNGMKSGWIREQHTRCQYRASRSRRVAAYASSVPHPTDAVAHSQTVDTDTPSHSDTDTE
eukprot:1767248-Rhodomonas_salina.1